MKTMYWYASGLFITLMYIYLLAVQYVRGDAGDIDFNYHNHESMTAILYNLSTKYPELCRLYSIGKSVQGNHSCLMHTFQNQKQRKEFAAKTFPASNRQKERKGRTIREASDFFSLMRSANEQDSETPLSFCRTEIQTVD